MTTHIYFFMISFTFLETGNNINTNWSVTITDRQISASYTEKASSVNKTRQMQVYLPRLGWETISCPNHHKEGISFLSIFYYTSRLLSWSRTLHHLSQINLAPHSSFHFFIKPFFIYLVPGCADFLRICLPEHTWAGHSSSLLRFLLAFFTWFMQSVLKDVCLLLPFFKVPFVGLPCLSMVLIRSNTSFCSSFSFSFRLKPSNNSTLFVSNSTSSFVALLSTSLFPSSTNQLALLSVFYFVFTPEDDDDIDDEPLICSIVVLLELHLYWKATCCDIFTLIFLFEFGDVRDVKRLFWIDIFWFIIS